MSNIGQLMKQIPKIKERAELHDKISVKTLEIVNEINQKIDTIIIPALEKLEKQQNKSVFQKVTEEITGEKEK